LSYHDPFPRDVYPKQLPAIEIGTIINRVACIDATTSSFFCDFKLYFHWHVGPIDIPEAEKAFAKLGNDDDRDPAVAESSIKGADGDNDVVILQKDTSGSWESPYSIWVPSAHIENGLEVRRRSDLKLQVARVTNEQGETEYEVEYEVRYTGTFADALNVHWFPVDIQELRVHVRFPNDRVKVKEMEMRPVSEEMERCTGSAVAFDSACISARGRRESGRELRTAVLFMASFKMDDWKLHQPQISIDYPSHYKFGRLADPKPVFTVTVVVMRSSRHVVHHLGTAIMVIVSMSFPIMLVGPENTADRMNGIVTLLLALFATKFLALDQLPKVPYYTKFDKFVNVGIFMIVLVAVQTLVVGMMVSRTFSPYVAEKVAANDTIIYNLLLDFTGDERISENTPMSHAMAFADMFDFVCFILSSVAYLIFVGYCRWSLYRRKVACKNIRFQQWDWGKMRNKDCGMILDAGQGFHEAINNPAGATSHESAAKIVQSKLAERYCSGSLELIRHTASSKFMTRSQSQTEIERNQRELQEAFGCEADTNAPVAIAAREEIKSDTARRVVF
jgi:hypothetical protein